MSSPSNTTKWMSYLAEGLLAEEEVQPSNPFFWCQNPGAEQVDCRYINRSHPLLALTENVKLLRGRYVHFSVSWMTLPAMALKADSFHNVLAL